MEDELNKVQSTQQKSFVKTKIELAMKNALHIKQIVVLLLRMQNGFVSESLLFFLYF